MPWSRDSILRITLALRRPETSLAAIAALTGSKEKAAVEGLVEVIYDPPTAQAATAAIAALEGVDLPLVVEALKHSLSSSHASVRIVAAQAIHRRGAKMAREELTRLLQTDVSWMARRAALAALADLPEPDCWRVLHAADDPHWRVRHALIEVLRRWSTNGVSHAEFEIRLAQQGDHPRVAGVLQYLRYRWGTQQQPPENAAPEDDPRQWCPFWDWDPAVLARTLEELGADGRAEHLAIMPRLILHDDEAVRRWAVETLRRDGEAEHLAESLKALDEPRHEAAESARKLFDRLDLDREEETAQVVLNLEQPSPAQRAWAVTHADSALEDDRTPRDAAESRSEPQHASAASHDDPHPYVRAAALTPERAQALAADPTQETSWHVLAHAARMAKVPLWELEPPEPWRPPAAPPAVAAPIQLVPRDPPHARKLAEDVIVAPLGISGHYGLPVEGFAAAVAAGVNLFFWEPNYATLTEFSARLRPADRDALHFVAGTFEATPKRIRRDAEQALRVLRQDRLTVFLLFWTRSWRRITDEVYEILERLREEGKLAHFGLSTHSRPLAVEAIHAGWNPIMVRHSAAHRGAEERILPLAKSQGVGLLAFNCTCYGRLLRPLRPCLQGSAPRSPGASAADCYRYTLAQEGVTACWSAPATLEQLQENLTALEDLRLPEERLRRLLAHGGRVYEEDTLFRRWVRSR